MSTRINRNWILFWSLACALLICSCAYIVLPDDLDEPSSQVSKGWSAVATNISQTSAGDLHIDLAIRNETGNWSAMQATPGKPAVLTSGGKNSNCDTVFVSTGGHRLAPSFQMRGFVSGTKVEPKTQMIYVECQGTEAAPGSMLAFDYTYVIGEYNYYDQEANKSSDRLKLDLDQVVTDLKYPVAEPPVDLVQKPGVEITAINDVTLKFVGAERTMQGLKFDWETFNPGEYPTYVHIGTPPVIGADGILYGRYESPDIASVPITPAGDKAEWTTEVTVPEEVEGLYILLSVESKKQRLFVNYALDITDQ